jgi:hypothetical protein
MDLTMSVFDGEDAPAGDSAEVEDSPSEGEAVAA